MKHLRSIRTIGTAAIALSAMLSHQTANANLLAYEGFDYGLGNLSGNNGGTGWQNAWAQNGGGSAANSQVIAGSYSYTDVNGYSLVTSGNRVIFTGDGSLTGDNIGGALGGAQPLRQLSTVRGNAGLTESTWVSFLALRTGNPTPAPGAAPNDSLYGRAAGVQFFHQTTTATTAGTEKFTVGRGTQSSETFSTVTALPNDTWGVLNGGAANATKGSSVNFASAPADFILMRIDHVGLNATTVGNADTLRVWINPIDLNVLPVDGAADIVFNSADFVASAIPGYTSQDFVFDRIRLFGGGQQGTAGTTYSYGSMNMDEFRIGTTFGDVTPNVIPEPATGALIGISALIIFQRRRS